MVRLPLDSESPPVPGGYLEPRAGDMLGPYRLDSVAGEGGMGRVFRSTHTKLNKRVAVKVLPAPSSLWPSPGPTTTVEAPAAVSRSRGTAIRWQRERNTCSDLAERRQVH